MKQITGAYPLPHVGLHAYSGMLTHTLPAVTYKEIALGSVDLKD